MERDHGGDLYMGWKVDLLSEYGRNPVALPVRGIVKLPTGDKDERQDLDQGNRRAKCLATVE